MKHYIVYIDNMAYIKANNEVDAKVKGVKRLMELIESDEAIIVVEEDE